MTIVLFLLGLCLGSFLNVVICRLGRGGKILFSRSQCPRCQKVLEWFELIPVFSFVIQKGRCRRCRKKISVQYPLVELATGVLFVLFGFDWLKLFFSAVLIVVFVYDLKHYLIPDKVIYPALAIGVIFGWRNWLAFLIAGGFFLILVLVSRERWMGWGDVKLATLMGLILGWPDVLTALMIAFVSGALVGLSLILLKKKTMKSQIPFGPFLAGATIIMMLK